MRDHLQIDIAEWATGSCVAEERDALNRNVVLHVETDETTRNTFPALKIDIKPRAIKPDLVPGSLNERAVCTGDECKNAQMIVIDLPWSESAIQMAKGWKKTVLLATGRHPFLISSYHCCEKHSGSLWITWIT